MRITIDDRWCKGCQLCIEICPKNVLSLSDKRSQKGYLMPEVSDIDQCINCKMCQNICPDICIDVEE